MTQGSEHSQRVSCAWQMVTCCKCKRHFRCVPSDDYYNSTTLDDGVCESCLVRGAGLDPAKTVTIDSPEHPWQTGERPND